MKLVPTRTALVLLALWLAAAIVTAFVDTWLMPWQLAGVALGAALVADALAAWRSSETPVLERRMAHSLAVGRWSGVNLRLTGVTRALQGYLTDAFPSAFDATGL